MKNKLMLLISLFCQFGLIYSQSVLKSGTGTGYDIKYHYLQFEADPAVYAIKGLVTTYFVTKTNNVNKIDFDLSTALTVDSAVYHKQKMSFIHADEVLTINLSNSLNNSVLDSISVYYHGSPSATDGFGAFKTSMHRGVPIMWTLSEPYGAKDWWPCKQTLNDKADSIDVVIFHPIGYKAASNGVLVSETVKGNIIKTHWKHRHPVEAYLVAFAITNYAAYSDYVPLENGDSIEVLNYVYPENLQKIRLQTPATVKVMQFYNKLFMTYPYADEKYGHAQFGWGGGMEHQTMSFMVNFDIGLIAHELSHQWFGDYITCAGWKNIWLNEGFATYCESLCMENGIIQEDWNNWKRNEISYITSETDGSLYVTDTSSIDQIFDSRLSYSKGGMVLHMLRWEIGDSAFFNGIRAYLHDEKLANAFASTENFKKHMEIASGKDLTYFFNDWVFGQGYPQYTTTWGQDADNIGFIKIDQLQSHPSVNFFELNVPIRFSGEGKDTVIVFKNTYNGQIFPWEIKFKVNAIYFDPNVWLITTPAIIQHIANLSRPNQIIISPNPVKEILRIKTEENLIFESVVIYNINGQKVKEFGKSESLKLFNYDVSELKAGNYFILFNHKGNSTIKKLVKI